MRNVSPAHIILSLSLAMLCACAQTITPHKQFSSVNIEAITLLDTIDRSIVAAQVSDAATTPVPGLPWLRIDRLQQTLLSKAVSPEQRRAWLARSYQLASKARAHELRNLPHDTLNELLATLPAINNRPELQRVAARATKELYTSALSRGELETLWKELRHSATVPDEYKEWMRWFGYPLVALPVKLLGDATFAKFVELHARTENELTATTPLTLYKPIEIPASIDLSSIKRDALGLLTPTVSELERLAGHYAPSLLQVTESDNDHIGALAWGNDQLDVMIDQPTGYYYLSHALIGEQVVPQLNYTFWYPARSGANSPWIERGRFDGLTIRVTLAANGHILMTDIMNNCGCYHFFLPVPDTLSDPSQVIGINPLTPRLLPTTTSKQLPILRTLSGWHQVAYLHEKTPEAIERRVNYQLAPYEELESLPLNNEHYRSAFDDNGILKGSERIEPYLLFAMGIPEVGAMRQRGNHPITLIGREHFDNPHLFERYFDFKPTRSPALEQQ